VFLLTVGRQFHIDELSSIVGVNAQDGKREQVPCSFQCDNDGILTAIEQGKAFGPSGGDIRERERVQVGSLCLCATMSD